jgi:hypothetical protein
VAADETGAPMRNRPAPRTAQRMMRTAGVRTVRLYDARHSTLTYLLGAGVPDVGVSAWAGHHPGDGTPTGAQPDSVGRPGAMRMAPDPSPAPPMSP